jgi:hypothetical protein
VVKRETIDVRDHCAPLRLRFYLFADDTGMFVEQLYNDYENHTLIHHTC